MVGKANILATGREYQTPVSLDDLASVDDIVRKSVLTVNGTPIIPNDYLPPKKDNTNQRLQEILGRQKAASAERDKLVKRMEKKRNAQVVRQKLEEERRQKELEEQAQQRQKQQLASDTTAEEQAPNHEEQVAVLARVEQRKGRGFRGRASVRSRSTDRSASISRDRSASVSQRDRSTSVSRRDSVSRERSTSVSRRSSSRRGSIKGDLNSFSDHVRGGGSADPAMKRRGSAKGGLTSSSDHVRPGASSAGTMKRRGSTRGGGLLNNTSTVMKRKGSTRGLGGGGGDLSSNGRGKLQPSASFGAPRTIGSLFEQQNSNSKGKPRLRRAQDDISVGTGTSGSSSGDLLYHQNKNNTFNPWNLYSNSKPQITDEDHGLALPAGRGLHRSLSDRLLTTTTANHFDDIHVEPLLLQDNSKSKSDRRGRSKEVLRDDDGSNRSRSRSRSQSRNAKRNSMLQRSGSVKKLALQRSGSVKNFTLQRSGSVSALDRLLGKNKPPPSYYHPKNSCKRSVGSELDAQFKGASQRKLSGDGVVGEQPRRRVSRSKSRSSSRGRRSILKLSSTAADLDMSSSGDIDGSAAGCEERLPRVKRTSSSSMFKRTSSGTCLSRLNSSDHTPSAMKRSEAGGGATEVWSLAKRRNSSHGNLIRTFSGQGMPEDPLLGVKRSNTNGNDSALGLKRTSTGGNLSSRNINDRLLGLKRNNTSSGNLPSQTLASRRNSSHGNLTRTLSGQVNERVLGLKRTNTSSGNLPSQGSNSLASRRNSSHGNLTRTLSGQGMDERVLGLKRSSTTSGIKSGRGLVDQPLALKRSSTSGSINERVLGLKRTNTSSGNLPSQSSNGLASRRNSSHGNLTRTLSSQVNERVLGLKRSSTTSGGKSGRGLVDQPLALKRSSTSGSINERLNGLKRTSTTSSGSKPRRNRSGGKAKRRSEGNLKGMVEADTAQDGAMSAAQDLFDAVGAEEGGKNEIPKTDRRRRTSRSGLGKAAQDLFDAVGVAEDEKKPISKSERRRRASSNSLSPKRSSGGRTRKIPSDHNALSMSRRKNSFKSLAELGPDNERRRRSCNGISKLARSSSDSRQNGDKLEVGSGLGKKKNNSSPKLNEVFQVENSNRSQRSKVSLDSFMQQPDSGESDDKLTSSADQKSVSEQRSIYTMALSIDTRDTEDLSCMGTADSLSDKDNRPSSSKSERMAELKNKLNSIQGEMDAMSKTQRLLDLRQTWMAATSKVVDPTSCEQYVQRRDELNLGLPTFS